MDKKFKLYQGHCIDVMRDMPPESIGAVITDPPYSSGGLTLAAKAADTGKKYCTNSTKAEYASHNFCGDNMDQRAFMHFTEWWERTARTKAVPGAPICVFCDWRQLPAVSDAIQMAGWIWRGTIAWDKVNARPQKGRPRQQAEFVVWGSNGAMPLTRNAPILPGVLRCTVPPTRTRIHQTQKPVEMMRELVRICEPGLTIFDPFSGSGSTLEAAMLEGYHAVGCELDEYYFRAAQKRLEAVEAELNLRAAG